VNQFDEVLATGHVLPDADFAAVSAIVATAQGLVDTWDSVLSDYTCAEDVLDVLEEEIEFLREGLLLLKKIRDGETLTKGELVFLFEDVLGMVAPEIPKA